ncbi:MAG: hypothetical protein CSA49_03430 [Gammaproteobacteria bacterium]|nr:MAG: hypothetical protein CSA49_03430 [Gammaproteobacteria bacterium]
MLANTATFHFQLIGSQEIFHVQRFKISEPIACLYEIELLVAVENPALNINGLLTKAGVLTLFATGQAAADQPARIFHGEVVMAEQEGVGSRLANYRITLAPKFWFLQQRSCCRIFQNISVTGMIGKLFGEAKITDSDYRFDLKKSYPAREFCVQYHESDFYFLSRLMEEEGIFYYFEHYLDRQVMVITDHGGSFKDIQADTPLAYHPKTGMHQDGAVIYDVTQAQKVVPNEVVLSDFNFEKPQLALINQTKADTNSLGHYHYPGLFTNEDQALAATAIQFAAHRHDKELIVGRSDSLHLATGCRFTLKDHPDTTFNKTYQLLNVEMTGQQTQSLEEGMTSNGTEYAVTFYAVPAGVNYRTPQRHRKHLIEGLQTAFVVGPPGEEIYTDHLGRIKVQFHWDREGQYDQGSSCWLRVQQPNAGNEWGALAIPRVGQEVVVNFMDGDLDRPIVTGALYHDVNLPPVALPNHKTRMGIKTRSYPDGGGYHELRIDDLKDSEQLYLHAQKNLDAYINNDYKLAIENDRHLTIEQSTYDKIGKDRHDTVGSHYAFRTGDSVSQAIGKDRQKSVAGNQKVQAGKDIHQKAQLSLVMQSGMAISLKGGAGMMTIDPTGVSIVGPMVKINSGGSAGTAKSASPSAADTPVAPPPGKAGKTPALQAPKHRQRDGLIFNTPDKESDRDVTPDLPDDL